MMQGMSMNGSGLTMQQFQQLTPEQQQHLAMSNAMMQGMKGMGVPPTMIPSHKSKILQGEKDDSDSPDEKAMNRHIFDDDDEDCDGASEEEDNSDLSSNEHGEAYEDEEPSDGEGYADEDDEDSDEHPNLKDLTEPPTEAELEKMKKEKVSKEKLDLATAEEEKAGCGE